MLQSIREHTQGWIAGAIITIIILTFALWGIHSYFVGGGASRIVATVNGEEITKEQVSAATERMRRQIQAQQGGAGLADESNVREDALKSLVDQEVLKQAAGKEGFLVSNQQVDNFIQNMPEFQVDGQFSVDRFNQVISATLMTASDFLEAVRTNLMIEQPRMGVLFSSFALPDEAKSAMALINQEREVAYLTIPSKPFSGGKGSVSQEKIKSYYENNRHDFMTPERVSIEYIELTVKDLYSKVKTTSADLKQFYEDNLNTYTRPAKWQLAAMMIPVSDLNNADDVKKAEAKAKELVSKMRDGASFTELAKHHHSIKIANNDMVSLNSIPAEYQKYVVLLKNTGEITQPIKTKNGFVIIKAVDVRPPAVESYDKVADKVQNAYIHQHAEEKFAHIRERLADLTYEQPDSLESASKDLGLKVKSTALFTKVNGDEFKGILEYKKVREVAFSNEVLDLQNNSDVLQLNPETVAVIRVKKHEPSALISLKTASETIEKRLIQENAEKKAEVYASDLLAQLKSGKSISSELATKELKWVTTGYLGRYSTKLDNAILDLAFRLPSPVDTHAKVEYGVARVPTGFAIVAVKGVKEPHNDSKQLELFAEQVQNSEGVLEYDLYKKSQIEHAKVKVNS